MIARSLWTAGLVALAGCTSTGGGETGNPVAGTPVAVSVRSSEPDLITLDPTDSGTLIEEAWFAFGQVGFLNDEACANFGEIEAPGASRLIADLTRENPGLVLEAEPGDYCGLLVPLPAVNAQLPGGAPAELERNSIVLRGRRDDGTPFLLTYPEPDELELEAEDGDIAVGDNAFLLSFDIATLMRGVDLDTATMDDPGVIRISGDQNRALLDRFELNLECSVQLYEDSDDDGQLDDGEPMRASCHEEEEDEDELEE